MKSFPLRSFLTFALGLISAAGAEAQIAVSGVADRGAYGDSVTFTVTPQTGYEAAAFLDAAPVQLGAATRVDVAGYHELVVRATNDSTGQALEQVFRFNVLATERNGSENGLAPWTPLPSIPSSFQETESGHLRLLIPGAYPSTMDVPVAVWVETATGTPLRVNGYLSGPGNSSIPLRRGVGSDHLNLAGQAGLLAGEFRYNQLRAEKTVLLETNVNWDSAQGTLGGDTVWSPGARISVNGDLALPAGATLTVGPGAVVRVSSGARIFAAGHVVVQGSLEAPVVFAPVTRGQPWGGFYLTNSTSRLEATSAIFTGSGAAPNAVPNSHRHEECLFFLDNHAELRLTNCAAISLAGQFGHSVDRGLPWNQVSLVDSLVQRCITGGEWNGAAITVLRSALVEMPFERLKFNDGDEDGIYFTTGEFRVYDSLFGWTGDDAIDAGSGGASFVVVSNTWVEATYHEAFAWSGGNRLGTNLHCVAINCGQGIECGWSSTSLSPSVYADDCLATANGVGARFGDNYDWTYNGVLVVTNSLLLFNDRDIWGMNWDDWVYRTNQMDLRGNWITAPTGFHPDNRVWGPGDAGRLVGFTTIPPAAPVGIGLAVYTNQMPVARLADATPVRLSHFTTNTITVRYTVESPGGSLASGLLEFGPGETVKRIPPVTIPADASLARLSLDSPSGGVLTGISNVWFIQPTGQAFTLVSSGSVWKYLDTGEDLGTVWREPGFDDSAWPSGPAELGYGDDKDGRPEATVIRYGTNSSNRHITYYFRRTIEVTDTNRVGGLELKLLRDDGGVVYINGREVFRSNLPDGPIDYRTTASLAADDGRTFFATNVPVSALQNGVNLVAAEIHQESGGSSDVSFDLQLEALPPVAVQIVRFGDVWFLVWNPAVSEVLSAASISGPWLPVSQSSPMQLGFAGNSGFYRLRGR